MTNELLFLGAGVLVGWILGWLMGRRRTPRVGQDRETTVSFSTAGGPGVAPGDEVSRLALERIAHYLKDRVEGPLTAALEQDLQALRDGAESVIGAVEDLEFFLQEPVRGGRLETHNLVDLVGEVTREFAGRFTVRVHLDAPPEPLRVKVDAEPLKDALFLILHNAGEFGAGEEVEMTLKRQAGAVRIFIRDRGPGFTAEALIRALDPFYSTAPGAMGLGLPFARKVVEAQGGKLALRNRPEGGGEVEIFLPQES